MLVLLVKARLKLQPWPTAVDNVDAVVCRVWKLDPTTVLIAERAG